MVNRLAEIADKLEKHMMRQMRSELKNWGRWWFRENTLVINRESGKITRSMSGVIMQYAPRPDKSGYYSDQPAPIDEEAALNLHMKITKLTPAQQREITRFYSEAGESGTSAQGQCRRRATLALIGYAESE